MATARSSLPAAVVLPWAALVASGALAACAGDAPEDAAGGQPAAERAPPDPNAPGVRQVGPNRYEAVILAYEGGFRPAEIRVPAGAHVTFRATSEDLTHGLLIQGTDVALELYPNRFEVAEHTFEEPGEYLFLCHIYCGGGHETMRAKVIVEPREAR